MDGLRFLAELSPQDAGRDVVVRGYRVRGELEPDALRRAWRRVVYRHRILRTGNEPDSFIALRVDDQSIAEQLWDDLLAAPVDLAMGPLARLIVLTTAAAEHRVLVAVHRTVADEVSLSIVVRELSAVEDGAVAQYADHTRRYWDLDRYLAWWTLHLTPRPDPLDLPVDRPRPPGPATSAGVVRFDWGSGVSRAVAAAGAPPFAVLLASFQVLLGRYGGAERVAVGVPMRAPSYAGVIGPLTNLLPLCADLAGSPGFGQVLARVAGAVAAGRRHSELPLSDLVRALSPERDPRRIPWCDATFALSEDPEPPLVVPGAAVTPLPVHSGHTWVDLALAVDRTVPTVGGSLTYRRALFDHATAESIVEALRALLVAGLDDPTTPIHRLPLRRWPDAPTWFRDRLAEVWGEVLGRTPVAGDFFGAGGHSLLLPALVDRIRDRFGVELSLWDCLADPTLAGMSAAVQQACAGQADLMSKALTVEPILCCAP